MDRQELCKKINEYNEKILEAINNLRLYGDMLEKSGYSSKKYARLWTVERMLLSSQTLTRNMYLYHLLELDSLVANSRARTFNPSFVEWVECFGYGELDNLDEQERLTILATQAV